MRVEHLLDNINIMLVDGNRYVININNKLNINNVLIINKVINKIFKINKVLNKVINNSNTRIN